MSDPAGRTRVAAGDVIAKVYPETAVSEKGKQVFRAVCYAPESSACMACT
jgi:hypothetical protein